MHTVASRCSDPRRQRRHRHRFAGADISGDPLRDLAPACRLPDFEWPFVPAEAPPDRQIEVARASRDIAQMHRAVMEGVAEYRPQELRLRMTRCVQQREFLGGTVEPNPMAPLIASLPPGVRLEPRGAVGDPALTVSMQVLKAYLERCGNYAAKTCPEPPVAGARTPVALANR